MSIEMLKTENIETGFDPQTGYLTLTYRGVLSPDITAEAYAWGFEFATSIGVEKIRAMITDFRDVTQFDHRNLRTASKVSRNLNTQLDLSRIAVPLIVKNLYQEQLVSVSMKLSHQEKRMKIVYSLEDAVTFIEKFHQELAKPEGTPVSANPDVTPVTPDVKAKPQSGGAEG